MVLLFLLLVPSFADEVSFDQVMRHNSLVLRSATALRNAAPKKPKPAAGEDLTKDDAIFLLKQADNMWYSVKKKAHRSKRSKALLKTNLDDPWGPMRANDLTYKGPSTNREALKGKDDIDTRATRSGDFTKLTIFFDVALLCMHYLQMMLAVSQGHPMYVYTEILTLALWWIFGFLVLTQDMKLTGDQAVYGLMQIPTTIGYGDTNGYDSSADDVYTDANYRSFQMLHILLSKVSVEGDMGFFTGAFSDAFDCFWSHLVWESNGFAPPRIAPLANSLFRLIVEMSFSVIFMTSSVGSSDADSGSWPLCLADAFYLTVITMTTVGYGDMSPNAGGWYVRGLAIPWGFFITNGYARFVEQFAQFRAYSSVNIPTVEPQFMESHANCWDDLIETVGSEFSPKWAAHHNLDAKVEDFRGNMKRAYDADQRLHIESLSSKKWGDVLTTTVFQRDVVEDGST